MMRSDFRKKSAIYAACLLAGILCALFSWRVYAAEENGIPQPSSARLYSDMSDESGIIANLIVGNEFEVVGSESDADGRIWYRVRTDFGAEGYMKAAELDRLIADAKAMMDSAVPVPEEDPAGEEQMPEPAVTEENNAGEASAPEEDNAGETPAPEEDHAGEAPVSEPVVTEEDNAREESSSIEDQTGEEPAVTEEDNVGEMSVSEAAPESAPKTNQELESNFVDGAGFGAVGATENDPKEFTIIEGTENTKVHKHFRIDIVFILIIAGGVLCIIAMAALLKRILTCVRTEA